ncbi:hypothetical protein BG011_001057 [Mortierella polycephala]|uniref:Uncharacterized protein n=1 Tax=Mortierella polycephala TaxID=41804 RepID=A0A9P6PHF5_9FUNG|nr:hypothetical protein BG011_001057 [Mortierella polycephala]
MSSLPGTEGKDGYEQESSGVSGSLCVKEYTPWLIEREKSSESVSFALFEQEFGFVDLEDAKAAYETLIKSSRLRGDRRRALLVTYEMFMRNKLQSFWSSHLLKMEKRETKTNLEIAVTKSARVVQTASAKEIANTANLLEDGGGDQDESACALKSKRKLEDGPLKENKRQEKMPKSKRNDGGTNVSRMTRDVDGDAGDATTMSAILDKAYRKWGS